MKLAVRLALLALLLSGCLSSGGGEGNLPAPAPPTVVDGDGVILAGAGTPIVSYSSGAAGAEFAVDGNVTLLYAELAWESPAVALDLCLHAPTDGANEAGFPICGVVADGGSAGAPYNHVAWAVPAPAAGTWSATPYLDGPALQQEFRLRVSLFHGEAAVPEGYTAL